MGPGAESHCRQARCNQRLTSIPMGAQAGNRPERTEPRDSRRARKVAVHGSSRREATLLGFSYRQWRQVADGLEVAIPAFLLGKIFEKDGMFNAPVRIPRPARPDLSTNVDVSVAVDVSRESIVSPKTLIQYNVFAE